MSNQIIRKLAEAPQQEPALQEAISALGHSIQCVSEQLEALTGRLTHLMSQEVAPTCGLMAKPQLRGSSATVCRLQAMRGNVEAQQEKLRLILTDLEA